MANPGVWVETIVPAPEPSVESFICLVCGVGFGIRTVQAIAASSMLGK